MSLFYFKVSKLKLMGYAAACYLLDHIMVDQTQNICLFMMVQLFNGNL